MRKQVMAEQYPDSLEIQPVARNVAASVSVPGSKSITNRALVLAALALTIALWMVLQALWETVSQLPDEKT